MPQMSKVKKAVFPVAGLGTRLLPATKTIPKEMLTIVDRPALDYVVEEAREAGIEHFVFVNGRNKHVIEDYFDDQSELYDNLERRGKTDILKRLKELQPAPGKTSFTRQQQPHGLGHAVWCARDIIGNEPFALLLPDMIMQQSDGTGCLAGMMDLHASEGGNVIAVQECDPDEAHKYGIVGRGEEKTGGFTITEMVEKPEKGTAPSNLYINGRYILQPEIFGILETQERGAGNEIQLTDAMKTLSADGSFFGYVFEGQTYDCGSPQGFIEANVAMAMARSDLRDSVAATLRAYL